MTAAMLPAHLNWPEAVATFVANGWTVDQWIDLHQFFAGPGASGREPSEIPTVTSWLCDPPATFATPITPTMVRDLYAKYGKPTDHALTVIAAGGTERFCTAFLNSQWEPSTHTSVVDGWANAQHLGLTEPEATGWAATDYLGSVDGPVLRPVTPNVTRTPLGIIIRTWINFFGPHAWLYVLAGIDLDEATAMRDAGTSPTEQQLRVMVALAGVVLPVGI